ncbi:hypothetical protein MTR67_001998, partial [Solanum verrucosum]
VRPQPVLVVRGSPLQPLPKTSSENWLSLDPRTESRSVVQTLVRRLCPWIKAPFTQPLTQITADQHRPSFNPRSVGLAVGEGQQPVRGKLLVGEALSGRYDLRLQSTDRRLTYVSKLERKRRREVKNPSSRTQHVSSSSSPEIEGFLRGIRHQMTGAPTDARFRPPDPVNVMEKQNLHSAMPESSSGSSYNSSQVREEAIHTALEKELDGTRINFPMVDLHQIPSTRTGDKDSQSQ